MAVGAKGYCILDCVLASRGQWSFVVNLQVRRAIAAPNEWRWRLAASTLAFCLIENFGHHVWIADKFVCKNGHSFWMFWGML
jgi:hypothetical protein